MFGKHELRLARRALFEAEAASSLPSGALVYAAIREVTVWAHWRTLSWAKTQDRALIRIIAPPRKLEDGEHVYCEIQGNRTLFPSRVLVTSMF